MIKLYNAKIYDFTQADYAKMYSLLDCAIKEKIDRKNSPKDKMLSLAGYILLWRGAKELYNVTELKITFNQHGKPLCEFCYFNISHSGDRVVCAFCDHPVGVDIQQIRDIKPREKYKFFNCEESCYVNKDDDISRRYIEVFTKKEAAIKMLGLTFADSDKVNIFSNRFNFENVFFDDFILTTCIENVSFM